MCVCQVSTAGTSSRGQIGHSDSGQKYTDFTFTSVNSFSRLAHPTSRYAGVCMNIVNITVYILSRSSSTETNCCITLP